MIKGIGIDIVDINKIKKVLNKQPKMINKILSETELEKYYQITHYQRQIEFVAGRFAVKEAFVKALGTGIRHGINFKDLNINNNELGAPQMTYLNYKVWISISHHENNAVAMAVIEE